MHLLHTAAGFGDGAGGSAPREVQKRKEKGSKEDRMNEWREAKGGSGKADKNNTRGKYGIGIGNWMGKGARM